MSSTWISHWDGGCRWLALLSTTILSKHLLLSSTASTEHSTTAAAAHRHGTHAAHHGPHARPTTTTTTTTRRRPATPTVTRRTARWSGTPVVVGGDAVARSFGIPTPACSDVRSRASVACAHHHIAGNARGFTALFAATFLPIACPAAKSIPLFERFVGSSGDVPVVVV